MSLSDSQKRQIQKNKASRELAEEVYKNWVIDALNMDENEDVDHPRFFEELATLCARHVGMKVVRSDDPQTPMDLVEATQFESTQIPWGQYKTVEIADVPHDYLLFITESDFVRKLRRYVSSRSFSRRQEDL